MNLLFWLPLAVIIAAYTCSWPMRPKLGLYLGFDGPAILFAIGLPNAWLLFVQTDNPSILETRQWMPLLLPLWITLIAIPVLLVIGIFRYFFFRDRRNL